MQATSETSAVPTMARHLERARLAEALGFAAIWLRDVPFDVPSFGDAGQTFDPFVYLGQLAARTERIALGVASVILPLRHPAHVAKAAASADVLSGGRLLLGVASGDRPEEYPALGIPFDERGERFRASVDHIRRMGRQRLRAEQARADHVDECAGRGVGEGGPVIVSVNPGSLLGTKMVRDAFGTRGNDIGIGVDILVRAARSKEFANASGRYFDNDARRFGPPHPDATDPTKCKAVIRKLDSIIATASA